MRKIIRTLSTITGSFPKYNLGSYIAKAREVKEYHAQQRIERKLLLLKRATLLSYISIVCTTNMRESLRFESKDRLIDYLICNGFAHDCISSYDVK